MSFRSILVANRGEIAVRILRTAKAYGYRTVAVYSDADAGAPHVRLADDSMRVGPALAAESYLNIENILAAAKAAGAEAVHPGYGFLAENAAFAEACESAGLTFIGPTPRAIECMGNKAEAKRRMIRAGVPTVPGYEGEDQSDRAFLAAAEKIGFPVMIKAAAGGGGRGMRLAANATELETGLRLARSEASNAFGSDELILERAIVRPRHVEVQVFADTHGNFIYLGERDCSVQRRHQKVVEEAPCPVMTEELRARMGAASVEAARAIDYRGAGTIEFLLDESGEFFFLEMNTRLQVEHPVTEQITGLDLVAMQIAVAQGEPLGLRQEDVRLRGHAIEVRLYAEDPAQGFLPSTGRVDLWEPPTGEGIRVDTGIVTGEEVSPYYDPMVAKIIAYAESREIALRRLVSGLQETVLFGPRSNRDFLIDALSSETFVRGEATTAFIPEEYPDERLRDVGARLEDLAAVAVAAYLAEREKAVKRAVSLPPPLLNWSSSGQLVTRFQWDIGDDFFDVVVLPRGPAAFVVRDEDREVAVAVLDQIGLRYELIVDGKRKRLVSMVPNPGEIHASFADRTYSCRNRIASVGGESAEGGGGTIRAPMHGRLLEVFVSDGDEVERGDRLAVLEAMKMQHEIVARVQGRVCDVIRKAGDQLAADDPILEIEIAES